MKIDSVSFNPTGDTANIFIPLLNTEKIYDVSKKLYWTGLLQKAGYRVTDHAGLSVYQDDCPIYRATLQGRIMVHKAHLKLAEILTKAITGESLNTAVKELRMTNRPPYTPE